jgi:hypothetical protein
MPRDCRRPHNGDFQDRDILAAPELVHFEWGVPPKVARVSAIQPVLRLPVLMRRFTNLPQLRQFSLAYSA